MPQRSDPLPSADDLERALRELGYGAFRPGQAEAIHTLLQRRRLLLVAPTGGGKSLTYQLPALLLPGTSIVVSPLIALMQDQVSALEQRGVAATYLASTLDTAERDRRLGEIAAGRYKLVYVAPERLVFGGFQSLLDRIDCPLLAVDEAHCISEWGHDFRPEYLRVGELVRRLRSARVLACTATATPVVRDEILSRLGLPADTPQLVRGFARPNLVLRAQEAQSKTERSRAVDDQLREALGSPGGGRGSAIVYCPTRRGTDEEAARLRQQGWRAAGYHAGMAGEDRDEVQARFSAGELEVVAATNAFGMGIDRADVRCVVHLSPPGSVEAYYQEVGRAGRDGEQAYGLLLSSAQDFPMRRRLLEMPIEDREPDPRVVEHKWGLFLELMRWAEGGSCRHDAILRYFGTDDSDLTGCGLCDVCVSLDDDDDLGSVERALIVRKALSAVARVHGKFGLGAAVNLLRGKSDRRLAGSGLDRVTTFGVLSEYPERWLTRLLQRCITAGWASFSGGERPLLLMTREGHRVMTGKQEPRINLPPAEGRGGSSTTSSRSRAKAAVRIDPELAELFEELRTARLEISREAGVPPYVVASDRSLRELAYIKPRNHAELEEVHGFGPTKVERYGDAFLAVVSRHR
ncbi:MAG: ATP-dependent DNA helicase RecQ [Polyangiaceae bacterium]